MEASEKPSDLCAAEEKDYEEAMRDWLRLEDLAQEFVNTKPLRFGENVKGIPLEALATAQSEAAKAKSIYQEREKALLVCRVRHGGKPEHEA